MIECTRANASVMQTFILKSMPYTLNFHINIYIYNPIPQHNAYLHTYVHNVHDRNMANNVFTKKNFITPISYWKIFCERGETLPSINFFATHLHTRLLRRGCIHAIAPTQSENGDMTNSLPYIINFARVR